LFKNHPERAFDLTWLAAAEEHFLGDALVTVGQRTAKEAVAWSLARIYLRGQSLGLVKGDAMDMPYIQQDLADALGLSLVHTNKTLAALRKQQLAVWSDGTLRVPDIQTLADVGLTDAVPPQVRPIL